MMLETQLRRRDQNTLSHRWIEITGLAVLRRTLDTGLIDELHELTQMNVSQTNKIYRFS